MCAHSGGVAYQANILLKHDQFSLCKHAQGTDQGTRGGNSLWITWGTSMQDESFLFGCPSLSCLTIDVASHRCARTRPVEPWALPVSGSEGSWISVQRHYKHDGQRCVHRLKHSSLTLASVPSRIIKLVMVRSGKQRL